MAENICPVTGFDCLSCEGRACHLRESGAVRPVPPEDIPKVVVIDYTNHRGERALRRIYPHEIDFQKSDWHPEKQWLMRAHDLDKDAQREFAMSGVHGWWPEPTKQGRIDISIAKQLQRSMERNARMSNRIAKLHRLLSGVIGESPIAASEIETALNRLINGNRAIEAILKDEEPKWPEV